jgi:hypothetical protein
MTNAPSLPLLHALLETTRALLEKLKASWTRTSRGGTYEPGSALVMCRQGAIAIRCCGEGATVS